MSKSLRNKKDLREEKWKARVGVGAEVRTARRAHWSARPAYVSTRPKTHQYSTPLPFPLAARRTRERLGDSKKILFPSHSQRRWDLASLPPNWLQLALPDHTEQTVAPQVPPAAAGSETPPSDLEAPVAPPPMSTDLENPVEEAEMAPRVCSGSGNRVKVARMDPPVSAGSVAPVEVSQTAPSVPTNPGNQAGPSRMPPPQPPPPVFRRPGSPVAPARTESPPLKRPAHARPMASAAVSGDKEASARPAQVAPRPPKPPVYPKPANPGVAAQTTPSLPNRAVTPSEAARVTPAPPPKGPVNTNPTNRGVAAQTTPPVSNKPATPPEAARTMPPPTPRGAVQTNPTIRGVASQAPPPVSNRPATPPRPQPNGPVNTNPPTRGAAAQTSLPQVSNRPATPADAARMMPPPPPRQNGPVSNRPATPSEAARMMPPPSPRRPVTNPTASTGPPTPAAAQTASKGAMNTRPMSAPPSTNSTTPAEPAQMVSRPPPTPAGAQTASNRPMNTRPMSAPPSTNPTTPAGPAQMVSRPPPRPMGTNPATPVGSTARAGEAQDVPSSVMLLEMDSRRVKPEVIRDIRERNRVALSVALDPRRDCTGDEVWYVSSHACHHVSGNLDLLSNLSPVSDCWVRSVTPEIQLFQALARGSVNRNGIILDDVWYVPDMMNIVSTSHLGAQGLRGDSPTDVWTFKRFDDSVAGRAHVGRANLFEMDFINTSTSNSSEATWYLVLSAQEHMTGNLELLTDYRPIRPSRTVRTHAGSMLQVCGKGSLKKANIFSIPDISFVPGLNKNIISISQLTDSGHAVRFERNGCKMSRRDTLQVVVGKATYGGEELIRLCSLYLDRPLPGDPPNP